MVAQLCPQALRSLFIVSYDLQEIFEPASTRGSTGLVQLTSLQNLDPDLIENTAYSRSSVIACVYSLPQKLDYGVIA
jgi:hypothetical protein